MELRVGRLKPQVWLTHPGEMEYCCFNCRKKLSLVSAKQACARAPSRGWKWLEYCPCCSSPLPRNYGVIQCCPVPISQEKLNNNLLCCPGRDKCCAYKNQCITETVTCGVAGTSGGEGSNQDGEAQAGGMTMKEAVADLQSYADTVKENLKDIGTQIKGHSKEIKKINQKYDAAFDELSKTVQALKEYCQKVGKEAVEIRQRFAGIADICKDSPDKMACEGAKRLAEVAQSILFPTDSRISKLEGIPRPPPPHEEPSNIRESQAPSKYFQESQAPSKYLRESQEPSILDADVDSEPRSAHSSFSRRKKKHKKRKSDDEST